MNAAKRTTTKKPRSTGKKKSSRSKKKKGSGFSWIQFLVTLLVLGIVLGACAVGGLFWWYSRDLPNLVTIEDYQPKQVTRVVDRDGQILASWTDADRLVRTVLSPDEIPDVMRHAIVSAEDGKYYEHGGLDFLGLLRAIFVNVRRGQLSQGASTITQQVVKNLVLSPERSIRRKVQEAILAWRLDDQLSKDDVLHIYLNEVFFGVHFYGIEEASQYYFGHSAQTLNVQEAALLGGLVQSPNRYNPFKYPDRALERRHYVLSRMDEEGYVEEGVYRAALESTLGLVDPKERRPLEGQFGYYVDAVRRLVQSHLKVEDLDTGGYTIIAAIDPQAQRAAEHAVQWGLQSFDSRHGFHLPYHACKNDDEIATWRKNNAGEVESKGLEPSTEYRAVIVRSDDDQTVMAIGPYLATLKRAPYTRLKPKEEKSWAEYFPVGAVFTVRPMRAYTRKELSTEDPSGTVVRLLPSAQASAVAMDVKTREVLALVGGYSFEDSPFNRAVQAKRQTGSTFKVFVYAAALNARKLTPATILEDQPLTVRMPGQKNWQPQNYDGTFKGSMNVRYALAQSRNVVAVRALQLVGLEGFQEFMMTLGFHDKIPESYTVALGSAELTTLSMTQLLSTFAGEGLRGDPVFVLDVQNAAGKSLWKQRADLEPAIDPRVAWLTTSMMRSVVQSGTGAQAKKLPFEVAGKTGTTNKQRDGWFTGFSSTTAASVWVGYDDNAPLGKSETGGKVALPIWIRMMDGIAEGRKPPAFSPAPDGVVERKIDSVTGLLVRGDAKGNIEYFLAGTEPTLFAPEEGEANIINTLLGGGSVAPVPSDDDDTDNDEGVHETGAPTWIPR